MKSGVEPLVNDGFAGEASKHDLPFLKIETDYSQSDLGQIRTRVEALFEMLPKK